MQSKICLGTEIRFTNYVKLKKKINQAFTQIFFILECNPAMSDMKQAKKQQADREERVNACRIQFSSYMGDYLFK